MQLLSIRLLSTRYYLAFKRNKCGGGRIWREIHGTRKKSEIMFDKNLKTGKEPSI